MMRKRARLRQAGQPVPNHYDFKMITKSGQARWVDFSVAPILYRGTPAIIGTGFDITDHKRVVEALREKENLLHLAQQAGRVGTFQWDIRTGAVEWSPELETLYNLKPGAFGGTYEAWAALVHPEDWPEADRRFREALHTGQFDAEWRMIASDGSVHWLAARGWVLKDAHDKPVRMVGINICITDRKTAEEALRRSEEQRRLAIKAARMGNWEIDLVHQSCTLDDRCREIWAAPDWTTVPMDTIFERMHPDDRPVAAEKIEQSCDPGGPACDQMEFRILWPDGQLRWVRAAGHVIFADQDGRRVAVRGVGITLDITEHKRAEQQLKDINEVLERRVAERTAVAEQRAAQLRALALELTHAAEHERRRLAQVLHDHLQQLLVGAKFRVSTLGRHIRQEELLQPVRQVAELLEESIQVSRSLTAELSPPVLYDRGFSAALRWLAGWMGDKHHLRVEVQAEDDADPQDEDLRVLLYQAVRELLFNVVKHARAGSATVRVARERDTGIRIVVTDDGVGFAPDQTSQGSDDAATGFGLFSIRERLQVLGGTLEVDSAPGHGTSVTIHVPVQAEAPEAREATSTEDRPAPPDRGRVRVLLVDDHRMFRDGLAWMLRMQPDLEVIGEAADGVAAIELARRLQPDVVVMDVALPQVNGIDATRHIVAELGATCVIGLSMYEEVDTAAAMQRAGAAAYLTKNGPPEALIAAIRACTSPLGPAAPTG